MDPDQTRFSRQPKESIVNYILENNSIIIVIQQVGLYLSSLHSHYILLHSLEKNTITSIGNYQSSYEKTIVKCVFNDKHED